MKNLVMAAAVSAATMMGSVTGVLAAEPFKIGLVLPYTGVFASLSENVVTILARSFPAANSRCWQTGGR